MHMAGAWRGKGRECLAKTKVIRKSKVKQNNKERNIQQELWPCIVKLLLVHIPAGNLRNKYPDLSLPPSSDLLIPPIGDGYWKPECKGAWQMKLIWNRKQSRVESRTWKEKQNFQHWPFLLPLYTTLALYPDEKPRFSNRMYLSPIRQYHHRVMSIHSHSHMKSKILATTCAFHTK